MRWMRNWLCSVTVEFVRTEQCSGVADLVVVCTSSAAVRVEGRRYYNNCHGFTAAGVGRFPSNLVDVRRTQFVARWYHSTATALVSVSACCLDSK